MGIEMLLMLVMLGCVLAYAIYTIFEKIDQKKKQKTAEKLKNMDKDSFDDIDEPSDPNEGKMVSIPKADIREFMDFDKISDDMIIQDGGSRYTMVVQCKGINYDLMSQIEQLSVEEGFISFLNTLKFPIQLYVQARAVDLRGSIKMFREKINELEVKVDDAALEYKRVTESEELDRDSVYEAQLNFERYNNMYEYASDITRYVERMSMNKHMLQRKFYIIFSYEKSEINSSNNFSKNEVKEICYRELYTRAQSIIGALAGCSVTGRILDSNELAELLYISYNRDDEKIIDVKQALESGFHRLYTTSKDVKEKKDELLRKEIEMESNNRIQNVIDDAIETSSIEEMAKKASENDDRVDKLAIKMIADAGLDLETKEALTKLIVQKHLEREDKRRTPEQKLEIAKEISKEQSKVYATVVENNAIPQQQVRQVQSQAQANVQPVRQVQPQAQANAQPVRQVQPQAQANVQPVRQVQPQAQVNVQPVRQVQPQSQVQQPNKGSMAQNILNNNNSENKKAEYSSIEGFVDESLIN